MSKVSTLYHAECRAACCGFTVERDHESQPDSAVVSADSAPILVRGRNAPIRVGMHWADALATLRARGWAVYRA